VIDEVDVSGLAQRRDGLMGERIHGVEHEADAVARRAGAVGNYPVTIRLAVDEGLAEGGGRDAAGRGAEAAGGAAGKQRRQLPGDGGRIGEWTVSGGGAVLHGADRGGEGAAGHGVDVAARGAEAVE
jgi:hypothetical protein